MLPVVAGRAETRRQILLYSIILAPAGASPWLLGYSGLLYGVTAIVAGAAMIGLSLHIMALATKTRACVPPSGCLAFRSCTSSCYLRCF